MMLADQRTVRHLGAVQGITVGGHQQFLLAEQFEVVATERAEEHVDLVVAAQIVGADTWRVIAQIGCAPRSEEHTSELQSLMRISYAVFCLKKKKTHNSTYTTIVHY